MGILNFIKNIFKEPEKPSEPEDLLIKDLQNWIQTKEKSIEKQDKDFSEQITNLKKELINTINKKLEELKDYNLDDKKAEERIKSIILENFNNYIRYTEKLIEGLENLITNQSKTLIQEIDLLLINFQEKSDVSYQKATFLIGEIGKIKESIDNFTKQLKKLINENQELIKTSGLISIIKLKQEELLEVESTEDQIKNKHKSTKSKITHIENQIKEIQEQITKIKKSKEYHEEINEKNKIDQENNTLTTKLNELKKLVDFKELAHKYHANEKEMNIIKDHRNNFQEAFEKDNGKDLEELVNKKQASDKIQEIQDLRKHINKLENNLNLKEGVEISLKEAEITKLEQDIKDQNTEQEKNNKLLTKITDEKDQIFEQLKSTFQEMNIILIISHP
jgi:hypothetical protein